MFSQMYVSAVFGNQLDLSLSLIDFPANSNEALLWGAIEQSQLSSAQGLLAAV